MADNDITITVDADNNTTAAFGAAARGARTVGEATQNANRALRESDQRYQTAAIRLQQLANQQRAAAERSQQLAREQAQLRTAIAAAGSATAEQINRLQRLDRQQNEARTSARLLAVQHSRSTGEVNDLARAYQRAERNAQQALRASLMFGANTRLDRNGNVIFDRRGRQGDTAGGDGPSGLLALLSTLPGLGGFIARASGGGVGATAGGAAGNPIVGTGLLAGGAGLAAVLAPLIGGAITGAIGAGAAFGGVGLGVAGAVANDPEEFQKRWDAVVQHVTGRWVKASASWVEPVKGSIAEVDRMLRRLPIESILSNSAAYLEPLTKGLTGFGGGLASGLNSLVKDVGPIVDMLGKRLPALGNDIGQFFAAIGKGSEGGAEALDDLLYALGRMTKGLGVTLAALADMYGGIKNAVGWFRDMGDAATEFAAGLMEDSPVIDRYADKVRGIFEDDTEQGVVRFRGDGAADVESDYDRVKKAASAAAQAVEDYVTATQKALDLAAGDKSAGLALSQGWITLNEELKEGKRTLDLNTQAGIDNQSALLDQVLAAEEAREAQLNLGVSIESANAQFDANIERIRQMAYNLGYNKQEVDRLISALGVLNVTSAAPKVELTGAKLAMDQGIALGALLNNISHTYTAKVQVVYGPGISLGNAMRHPIGGPTSPGPSIINDWQGLPPSQGGGEMVSTPAGSMIYGGAAARGSGSGGGRGGGGVSTVLLKADASRAGAALLELISIEVSAQGGRPELLGLKSGR